MTVTLDPSLQARLNGVDRQPDIEILSTEFTDAIPFQGNSFGISKTTTFNPHITSHSSGRLCMAYVDSNYDIQYMFTDVNRNQWAQVDLSELCGVTVNARYVALCELANGNLGVVFMASQTGGWKLWDAEITVAGVVVSQESEIESLSSSYQWYDPFVTRFDSGTYCLVYMRETTDTTWDIMRRTCTTWGSWGAASAVTPSNLNTSRPMANPSLLETDIGDIFLFFDYVTAVQDAVTISNIFSAISTNDGSSWGNATARTNYVQFGNNGVNPIAVQKSNGTVWLIFYENRNVLHMDNTATGFTYCSDCYAGGSFGLKGLHCDSANGKIYAAYGNSQIGTKCVGGVALIDIDTWSLDKVYFSGSTPALSKIFCDGHVTNYRKIHGDGKYFAMSRGYNSAVHVTAVIDHTTDTVTHYVTQDDSISADHGGAVDGAVNYSLPKNITFNSNAKWGFLGIAIQCIRIDASRDRIYLGWDGGYYRQYYMFSYIDLTDVPDGEGMYSMSWVTSETYGIVPLNLNRAMIELGWSFEFDLTRGYIIVISPGFDSHLGWYGCCCVLSEAAGAALVKQYDYIEHGSAPRFFSSYNFLVYDGSIYAGITYEASFPHTDQRGLCKINYTNDTITYFRPGFASADNYAMYDLVLDADGTNIYIATPWGVAKFEIASGAWTIFNSDTLQGFVRTGESSYTGFVTFDTVNANVIFGGWNDYITNYFEGVGMFSEHGPYNQLQYMKGDKLTDWEFAGQADLSYYSTETNPTAALDIDDTLWVVWDHDDWQNGLQILYWDNDLGEIAVQDDLVGSVQLRWALKRINRVTFALANGHLYDAQNLLSTKNVVGQKGRKITVRIGEVIGDYSYWVNQGTYIVESADVGYTRGKDPILNINGIGKTSIWKEKHINVSALYSGADPDDVIIDLIQDHTELLSTEYSIPTIADEHRIYYQWLDRTLYDMIEEICDHFFYAMVEDADGIFRIRPVDLDQSVDHEYTDQTLLTNFSPDDSYSNYTNRVRVIGEANDYTEVVHSPEMITTRAGTIGWWVKKNTETIYFDEDQERVCREAYLVVQHSPDSYGLLMDQLSSGQGKISIVYEDVYDKYIIVEIEVPDLTMALVTVVGAMIAVGIAAATCDGGFGVGSHCGWYIMALAFACGVVFYFLGAMAQYQYEVWASPVGKVKLTIQYEANDVEFQRKLNGEIVTQEITDPLCNDVIECRRVAEGNLNMLIAQRRRLSFSKLAHLQDELLDKLRVYHPYSGEMMDVLVVGLKRTYTKGKDVIDRIEGWRYIP